MPALLAEPALFLPAAFVLGLVVGSFLNVVIHRLPRHMEAELEAACREQAGEAEVREPNTWFGLKFLITPPSTCPHCGHRIRALENIPLVSWLRQRGRCAACEGAISVQYPLVELATALLSSVVVWHFGVTLEAAAALLLTWALVALSVIDLRIQLLPDVLILPLIWLGLVLNLDGLFTDIHSAVWGAVAGYLFLWFLYHLFLLLTGKEGMGYGDFKLFALFGAWLGWQYLPQILLFSAAVGAVTGLAMIFFLGRERNKPIPFGPYLAAAGWVALLWGEEIQRNYLRFVGF